MPLVAVFLPAAFGFTSRRMGYIFRRHLAVVKLGMTLCFALMAVIVIHNLRWIW